ncbi:MAG: DUF7694 domain-containing protein [Paraclostridium sp.]
MAKRRKVLGWIQQPSPKNKKQGTGWFGELSEVFISSDRQYCVMLREIDTNMGKVTHACMRNQGSKETNWKGTHISWSEKQRIKNEIFGKESVAIEVFPKESELVDQVNMYHIWVLHGFDLPFGL